MPFVIVRNQKKGYGSGKLIEGTLKPGESVVIVEDILTTGGQIVGGRQVAGGRSQGRQDLGAIDRLEGASENIEKAGYVFESLFTTKDLGIV